MKTVKTAKFDNSERHQLEKWLLSISHNPYTDYAAFCTEVQKLGHLYPIAQMLSNLFHDIPATEGEQCLPFLIKNCPIDVNIPDFDLTDPVESKYEVKKTFIGEAFLQLIANFKGLPPLAYETRNNGDFFHDVYAQSQYFGTQTQKTDGELHYHNDRTAHEIRSDMILLLGMRTFHQNEVLTLYIHGPKLVSELTTQVQGELRKTNFETPFDNYSSDSNGDQQVSLNHAILTGKNTFRFYEGRTTTTKSAPASAKKALAELIRAIEKAEQASIQIKDRDLLCIPNMQGLHSRSIGKIGLPERARHRYLLKTYNFKSPEVMKHYSDNFPMVQPGLFKEL